MDNTTDIISLFGKKQYLNICAPMVRYSKLQFRQLVRQYNCDLAFSPMILADSFILSENARKNEFTTSSNDHPLVVQFAASTLNDFVGAATLVSPFCNGVDLNCGCPQRWAKKLGLGCALMDKPELICSMIKEAKAAIKKEKFTVSVKTRILNDLKHTVDLCCKLDKAGASFITIHGRTPDQSTGEVQLETIKLIKENVSCPVIANGGVETVSDCERLHKETLCDGIMVANGLLTNPTLFAGCDLDRKNVKVVVEQWIVLCFISHFPMGNGVKVVNLMELCRCCVTFQCFHHHLVFMLSKVLNKREKQVFNNLKSVEAVLQFICDHHLVPDVPFISTDLVVDDYLEKQLKYDTNNEHVQVRNLNFHKEKAEHRENASNGKFFNEFTLDNLFLE